MSLITIGIIGVVVLLLLFALGMPVAFAMALVGFAGFAYLVSPGAGFELLAVEIFENFSSYSLTVIPMFVFMGTIAFEAGISRRLYDATYSIFGQMRGGLAIATVGACAGFSAICGSTNATAASMARVALPEMQRHGYGDTLATGCVTSAGSLGILIPPSALLIVYGVLTQQAIGELFIAGVLPGILLASLFIITVIILCWRNPALGPAGPATTLKQKVTGLSGVTEMLVLFIMVMAGLFLGWFSPTQAGGAGAAGALIIALVRREMGWRGFVNAAKDALLITCMVMLIVAGAMIFGKFVAVTKIPFVLSDWAGNLPIPAIAIMAIIVFIHLIGGCFMDAFALIVLTVPIVYPVVLALNYDPVWFGIIIVLVAEMGTITPPVGINAYVVSGVAEDVPLTTIFKGIFPFLGALIVATILLLAFPEIATFLPSFMTY
ncbi:MAG: TRAP transporter large permease [Dehalococcoidia bacterium]